jgi:hypothetical protein
MRRKLLGIAVVLTLLPLGALSLARPAGPARPQAKHKKKGGLKFKTQPVAPKGGGGEPSLAMGKGKYQYISFPGDPGMGFYFSANNGKTWTLGGIADDNSGDTSVNIDQSGAVYQSNLRGVSGSADTLQGDVYKSLDHGVTWGPAATNTSGGATATDNPVHVDREWTDAWIPPGKTTDEAQVYIGYHDFGPGVVWVNASLDGGKTFGPAVNVITDPAAAAASACNTIPGSLKVVQKGPHAGRVYMSWIAADAGTSGATGCNYTQKDTFYNAWVAWSDDQGVNWTDHLVYDGGPGHDMGALFPDMTLDRKGNPYIAVADNLTFDPTAQEKGEWDIYVFASFDGGVTWNGSDTGAGQIYKVNSSTGTHYYPSIAAGKPGMVDVAWIETPNLQDVDPYGKPSEPATTMTDAVWNVYMGQTRNLKSGKPKWKVTKVTKSPIHTGDVCVLGIFCTGFGPAGASRSLLDFIDIAVDKKGKAHIAYTADYDDESACICVAHQTKGPKVVKAKKKHHKH